MSEFGDRLKQARQHKKMSQAELAAEMKMSQAAISQFESGQRYPTPATISRFAEILCVDRGHLAGESEGGLERQILQRNLKGLSPKSIQKINEFVELMRLKEKQKK